MSCLLDDDESVLFLTRMKYMNARWCFPTTQALLILALMSPDGIWHNHLLRILVCRRPRRQVGRESTLSVDTLSESDYLQL